MTKITKLLFHGFKSFKHKTILDFGDNFNCVLGPNGSGKSNICDGLTFVLGRRSSKSMRAEKSANLIYHGGKKGQGSKNAEVSIFFDNEKKTFPMNTKEVKISRIVNKKGASTYKINDKKASRNDILNLLSHARVDPNGYNIILQGDIVRFVEMQTEERRKIIEEIAGINIYEDKKNKAEKELNKVEEKLKEANIVLEERKTYLKELKKDRDQALEYKDIKENIGKYAVTLLTLQVQEKQKDINHLEAEQKKRKDRIAELQKKIKDVTTKSKEKQGRISSIDKEIEQKGEKTQVALNKEIEELKITLATNETKQENLIQELERMKKRREDIEKNKNELTQRETKLKKEIEDLENYIKQKEKDLKDLGEKVSTFKKKHNVDQNVSSIENEIAEIEKDEEKIQIEIAELRQAQQSALREKDQLEFKLESLEEQEKKVSHLAKEHKIQLKELQSKKERLQTISSKLNKVLEEDSSLSVQLVKYKQELEHLQEKQSKAYAEQLHRKERFTGDRVIDEIISRKSQLKGIHGTVSDLGKVKGKYGKALDLAAAGRLKNIVVDADETAKRCIEYLKKNKLGTATFLPLNKIKAASLSPTVKALTKKKEVHGMAVDLISFDKKYEKVFRYVFGNTLVVENIDSARNIGIGTTRMVTLDGDIVEVSGAMRGGFIKQIRSAGFKQKEMEQDLARIDSQIQLLEIKIKKLRKNKDTIDEEITTLREEKASREGEVIKLEKSLHISGETDDFMKKKKALKEQVSYVKKNTDDFQARISKQNRSLAEIKTKKQQLRERINTLQKPTLVAQLAAFQENESQIKEKITQMKAERHSLVAQINNIIEPDIKKSKSILKENQKEEIKFKQFVQDLKKEIVEGKNVLKEKEKAAAAFYKKFKKLFQEREQLNNQVYKLNQSHAELDRKERDIEVKVNNINLEETRLKAEMAGLQKALEDYVGIEPFKTKTDLQEMKRTVIKLETKLEHLGNVNMRALEVYDNIEKEYEKLLKKKESLYAEKDDVLQLMDSIEEKKKQIFRKSFEIVNNLFRSLFKKLTKKGDAFLELENKQNPFAGGVVIKVKLSSKRFMDIKSLSGGEKTLTALAFIFSIQEHEPASFYILDEVDAALDKKNSEKLSQLIKAYAKNSQYIVISHNDSIISEANNLYGISMDEHSVSKITSLAL